MSFYGTSFSFDGVSCEEFGLMLYDVDGTSQGNSKYATQDIIEDRLPQRSQSLFYGTNYKDGLNFTLVFGADAYAAQRMEPVDRWEMQKISAWLTDHNEYKWLVIDQEDMQKVRYHCILTGLEVLDLAGNKWAFKCEVHCDSPYGYLLPKTFEYNVDGIEEVVLQSDSSSNSFYYPDVTIELNDSSDFTIENSDDPSGAFELSDLTQTNDTITIKGSSGVMVGESGLNLYQNCNFKFPRLKRGDNHLTLMGNGTVKFTCEFPVMIGG